VVIDLFGVSFLARCRFLLLFLLAHLLMTFVARISHAGVDDTTSLALLAECLLLFGQCRPLGCRPKDLEHASVNCKLVIFEPSTFHLRQ
jgi:hypothetical protein